MSRSDLLAALALALAACALYATTLGYDFTDWDDTEYVLENPLIRTLDPGSLGAIFSHFYLANYAPLHLGAYSLVYATAGPAPWAFHALNLGLHALCTALVFLLLRGLGLPRAAAALGGAIFLAHPVQVEAVAWVNQTKTLLASAFGFGSLLLLLRFRARRAGVAYLGALALYACALLSKPQAVAFPGIFFCVDRALSRREGRLPASRWAPFVLMAVLFAWVAVQAQGSVGAVKAYGPMGFAGSLLRSLVILAEYLRITFLPVDLSVLYQVPHLRSLLDGRLLVPALLVGGVALAAWRGRGSAVRPWHALGAYLAPLVPVLGWVPLNVPMADRYLYPALFGLAWFSGGAARALPRTRRAVVWAVPVLLAVLSIARMPVWQDGATVWEHEIAAHPDSAHAWHSRGSYRYHRDDLEGAAADFEKAIALDGTLHEAWTGLGLAREAQGRRGEAREAWREALAVEPRADWPRLLLARDLGRQGREAEARALIDEVLAERPDFAVAYLYRAASRQRSGDTAGAEADLLRAIALDPFVADAYAALGRLREERGDTAGARAAYLDFLKYWGGDLARADAVRERLSKLR